MSFTRREMELIQMEDGVLNQEKREREPKKLDEAAQEYIEKEKEYSPLFQEEKK
ncbi:hypothetical protein [Defluviitalea saccharophila]|uniref:Uncharacterized protein n=1 Tax=Defluviitalea saccharophila TaxID=879970 RepID=A0ABZ2Y603_9FIRM|nr:hypothetical protein [Candidatus Epulonipiscium sp.]